MTDELRCYTWTLYQLSSIQQGIQAGHAAVELVHTHDQNGMVQEWAAEWKTMVLLNGGDHKELNDFADFLAKPANPFPWEPFHESEDSLGLLMTSVAMIVPARIFEVVSNLRKKINLHTLAELEPWELELVHRMAESGLAR